MFRNYLLVIALCGATCAVHAQELFALSGALKGKHHSERTFTGQIDYQQRLGESIAFSGGSINEGHLSGHHRDGATAQIWARTDALDRRLTLAAGIGPYVYFDTVPAANADGSHDDHGVGVVASLAATWHFSGPWSMHLRVNHIATDHSVDTTSLCASSGLIRTRRSGARQARGCSAPWQVDPQHVPLRRLVRCANRVPTTTRPLLRMERRSFERRRCTHATA